MKPKIAQVIFPIPIDHPFDYLIPESMRATIKVGSRVEAPFHYRRMVGFVIGLSQRSRFGKLKSLFAVPDQAPVLDNKFLAFTKSFASLCGCSLGEAIDAALPAGLRTKKTVPFAPPAPVPVKNRKKAQQIFCHDEDLTQCWPTVIERIRAALKKQESVLFLVPEAAAMDTVAQRIGSHLEEPVVRMDKQMTLKQEREVWISVKEGKSRLVLGARSAVFAPLARLGLLIVYEEENPSYQQEQTPFYHARDVALARARTEGCDILFISSAPSATLWHWARGAKVKHLHFKASHPAELKIIDLTNYKMRKRASISFPLQNSIREVLSRGGKVVLMLNRRGFSTRLVCNQCGHIIKCPRCEVNLSFIYHKKKLQCPLCRTSSDLPEVCPACRAAYLRYLGAGIEKLESETARLFPAARVARFDRDTASWPREADIVIATQALVGKTGGAAIDLVALLDIDSDLSRIDFRSAQKVFSLLIRLRQRARETLLVQTYWRDHLCFKTAAKLDFQKFYREELKARKECRLPPFADLVAFGLRGAQKEQVASRAAAVYEKLKEVQKDDIEILEPQADMIPKLRDKYRFTIMLKGKTADRMIPLIRTAAQRAGRKAKIVETIHVNP